MYSHLYERFDVARPITVLLLLLKTFLFNKIVDIFQNIKDNVDMEVLISIFFVQVKLRRS